MTRWKTVGENENFAVEKCCSLTIKRCVNVKCYLNLSGPIENKSSLTVGRRLRVAAFIIATKNISRIKPKRM